MHSKAQRLKIIVTKFYSKGANRDGDVTKYVRKNPKKWRFFRNFLSLNEGNLKFKEPPWKQHI